MQLIVRYENKNQIINLNLKEAEELMESLSLKYDKNMSEKELDLLIQDAWDEGFNKPEYNNLHKFERHRGLSSKRSSEEDDDAILEPQMYEVKDPTIFCKEEMERNDNWEYEEVCRKIRGILKQSAAEMVIAIALDGMSVGEYADLTGDIANNVSHRYRRAIKKLKDNYLKTSF